MTSEFDVIVVGAGVVGMATALSLIDRGHRVTVIDAAQAPGMGTSHANGAQLCYAYTDALGSPSTLRQLPGLLIATNSAFRLHASLGTEFVRWGVAFLGQCTSGKFLTNTLLGLELANESRRALDQMVARHNLPFDKGMPGKLHIYRTADSFAAASRMAAIKREYGVQQEALNADGAMAIEPMLAPVCDQIAGALYTPREEVGDPFLFCSSACQAMLASGRGAMMLDTKVTRITAGERPTVALASGECIGADRVVLCGGLGSAKLARTIGVRLPIQPMKGYSITAQPGDGAPQVCITDVANRVVFARLGNRMRIAGLAELGNFDRTVDPKRLELLKATARAALPGAIDYDGDICSWAGLRPMSPNSLPMIRPIANGVIANTGHGSLGWTYAAGAAERVATIIAS